MIRTDGLSHIEDWGRWSDANVSDAVLLRFFEPLPESFRLNLTCMAFGPNAGHPVRVEIGNNTQVFSPTPSVATYGMEFVLDRPERSIKLCPPSPTSPGLRWTRGMATNDDWNRARGTRTGASRNSRFGCGGPVQFAIAAAPAKRWLSSILSGGRFRISCFEPRGSQTPRIGVAGLTQIWPVQ